MVGEPELLALELRDQLDPGLEKGPIVQAEQLDARCESHADRGVAQQRMAGGARLQRDQAGGVVIDDFDVIGANVPVHVLDRRQDRGRATVRIAAERDRVQGRAWLRRHHPYPG
jgi:hypothetical protein